MKTSNKLSLYVKKGAALVSLFSVALLFQNFAVPTIRSFLSISPQDISVSVVSHKYDRNTNTTYFHVGDKKSPTRVHEAKVQGEGELPYTYLYKQQDNKPVVAFEINNSLQKPISNDRSEIRLVGTNSFFGQTYYSSFKFFYPENSAPIINNHTTKKDWGLIWQCPQIGGGSSPPLSLHIENDILSVTTITDFRVYSNGKPYYNNQPILQLKRNKWHTVMIRYSLGLNGSYSLWVDGQKMMLNADYNPQKLVEAKYMPIGFKDVLSPSGEQLCTVRYGLYKKAGPGSFKVLFGDVKFGTSYNEVVQRN